MGELAHPCLGAVGKGDIGIQRVELRSSWAEGTEVLLGVCRYILNVPEFGPFWSSMSFMKIKLGWVLALYTSAMANNYG